MFEQSIASYISNLASLGIMILVALFLFLIIFIISKILVKSGRENSQHDNKAESKNLNRIVIQNKDPYIFVNLAAAGFFFLFFIIFILMTLFFLIFSELINIKLSLFFIAFALIFAVSASAYIVKSKIFK
ncbi:MAG: hypothetical protein M1409_10685 [Actinobacteria bacterium]|nr:hypothetical protein [Actinomycetota bacterium]